MRLVVLASIAPDFRHFRAGQTVLAEIIEALANQGVQITVALAGQQNKLDGSQLARLERRGISMVDSQSFNINHEFNHSQRKWRIRQALSVFQFGEDCDFFGFTDPDNAADEIANLKPDAVLLFWDTYFEHILPELIHRGIACYAYSAKPRQSSGFSSLGPFKSTIHKWIQRLQLNAAQKRHIGRYKLLRDSRNICNLDCSWYASQGVHVKYLSNTWPDAYGEDWQQKRLASELKRPGLNILANIGGLNATGNTYGLQYLADKIMPILTNKMPGDWTINICGRFQMPGYLKEALNDPRIKLLGFVDDIDDEVIGNEIFMLLNNAGPYTGGYTRVMYAFSAGACLVGHSKLSISTPELVSGQNCLLADTPEEIAELAMRAARDSVLRLRIGAAARETYNEYFKPSIIARKIRQMIDPSLNDEK